MFHELESSTVAAFDPNSASGGLSSDVTAGVLQRFGGRPPFTALLVVDPGDALLWLQRQGATNDPLACFVEWGGHLLSGVAEELPTSADVEHGTPALEERPLMAALLATHPPADTLILSIRGELVFSLQGVADEVHAPFSIHVLLEPKFMAGIPSPAPEDTNTLSR